MIKSGKFFMGILGMLLYAGAATALTSPDPETYGMVIIRNFSGRAGFAPVQFDHWLHRAFYTCRLCHVDIGFAMEENGTKITAESNGKGYHCGACHNGVMPFGTRSIFKGCSTGTVPEDLGQCERCHSLGKKVRKDYDFDSFKEKLPERVFGHIDWEVAQERGIIKPVDILEDVSIKRPAMTVQKDFSIESKSTWMSSIIFSHKKHAIWNGCEVCHPDIFPSTKKGTVRYSMFDISAGQYCGACHGKVAFPINECERCHIEPVGF
jgi:c(7)-type cytochrome triheme protein